MLLAGLSNEILETREGTQLHQIDRFDRHDTIVQFIER